MQPKRLETLNRDTERKPRRVSGLKGVKIEQAAIGGWHCLAVSAEGQAFSWGGNEYGQCGLSKETVRRTR
jgi:alpha-tubulin suppressor-like RCC1 family protein